MGQYFTLSHKYNFLSKNMDFVQTAPRFEIRVSLSPCPPPFKSLHFTEAVSCDWDYLILRIEVQVSLAFRKLLIALQKSVVPRNISMLRAWLAGCWSILSLLKAISPSHSGTSSGRLELILFSRRVFSERFCKFGECIEWLAIPKCHKSGLISGDAPLPVDANVPVVSMPVGVSQDLSKILALWSFLTSSTTSPGKPFTVVSTVL